MTVGSGVSARPSRGRAEAPFPKARSTLCSAPCEGGWLEVPRRIRSPNVTARDELLTKPNLPLASEWGYIGRQQPNAHVLGQAPPAACRRGDGATGGGAPSRRRAAECGGCPTDAITPPQPQRGQPPPHRDPRWGPKAPRAAPWRGQPNRLPAGAGNLRNSP